MKAMIGLFAMILVLELAALPGPIRAVEGISSQTLFHGGGCRKSSPPGKCCHMDRSTGKVHCH